MASPSEESPLVLVTGLAGFTGSHLTPALEAKGYRVRGLDHVVRPEDEGRILGCDLLDRRAVADAVNSLLPQAVIHLAGIALVTHGDVSQIYQSNIMGTRNLLEALSSLDPAPRNVILASSANVYGNARGGMIDETMPPAPANDYAVSKLAMEYMALTFASRLPLTIVRPFNYTGPGQSTDFVVPKIVAHFRDRRSLLELGNLDVSREFSDVRRTVEAYARLVGLSGQGEIYDICGGVGISLRSIIETTERLSGHRLEIRVNPAFVRENEVSTLVGSPAKLEGTVGALPRYDIEATIAWMLET